MRTRTLCIHFFILHPLYCFRCDCLFFLLFCTQKIQPGCFHLLVSAFVCFHLYFICTQLFANARFVFYQFAFFHRFDCVCVRERTCVCSLVCLLQSHIIDKTKCGTAHAQQMKNPKWQQQHQHHAHARNKFKTRYKFVIFTNLLCRANSLWSFRMTENDVTSLCARSATIKFRAHVRSVNLLLSIELCTLTHTLALAFVQCHSVYPLAVYGCTSEHGDFLCIVRINRCIDGCLLCCSDV